jgi:hypothetical protein
MIDFLIGFAFVAMILAPAVVASIHREISREDDE